MFDAFPKLRRREEESVKKLMENNSSPSRRVKYLVALLALSLLPLHPFSQAEEKKSEAPTWKDRLYESGVVYSDYASDPTEAVTVATYFLEHPLRKELPICHNDCPIIVCRPVVPFPTIAKDARVQGIVSVHVLVDENGKVIYARVLSGHPLLQAVARKGAIETRFREYPRKHQGVMHFTVKDYRYLDVPNTASEVL